MRKVNINGKFGTTYDALLRVIPNLKEMVGQSEVSSFKLRAPERYEGKGKNKVPVFGPEPFADTFMPLCVDILERTAKTARISIAHYYRNGEELVCDPDVELFVDFERGIVDPLAIQHCTGHYQRVYANVEKTRFYPGVRADLFSFLSMWFKNLRHQGHVFDPASVSK